MKYNISGYERKSTKRNYSLKGILAVAGMTGFLMLSQAYSGHNSGVEEGNIKSDSSQVDSKKTKDLTDLFGI